ncbi:DUF6994 family protein [Arthrobacter sp. SO3]|uniref:DUF6994 family protein n=1 Tax=Arthrobacter sp. SO3 TaxID=1897057 RepID=UPI0039B0AD44
MKVHEDLFELFGDFKRFMEFFHFQDLLTPDSDYESVEYFLPPDNFERQGTPTSTPEYVEYRGKVPEFLEKRNHRMAEWVRKHHPDIEVRERRPAE